MAGIDATASKTVHTAVKKFITLERWKLMYIHCRMRALYGDACVSKPMVTRRARMFMDGPQETRNLTQPGQAHKAVAENMITNTDAAIKGNQSRNIPVVAN
ncbi:uncharacterized protein TNCV_1926041 [Trichonephila clavipes]|nr:uncharacterized protein TNCV_1926041 [Trichonephila clavipes]